MLAQLCEVKSGVIQALEKVIFHWSISRYNKPMTAKILEDVMQLAESWPESAQQELADYAREIAAGLLKDVYYPTPEELAGVDRGLRDADAGRFASAEEIEAVFAKYRPKT
jgi:predicted transcriptional regulator